MTTITTRRHPIKFYILVTFGTLFLCAFGTLSMFASIDILQKEQLAAKGYFMPALSLATYFLAFSMIYAYWKNSPKITVDKHIIRFGDQTFYIKDIKEIAFTGKMPFRFIMSFPMEGTAILFNDGTKKILFDSMYSNSPELKLYLEQVVLKKQVFKPAVTNEISKSEFGFESEETFKGNQFTSLRGISLWGLTGLFTLILFRQWDSLSIVRIIFIGVLATFWFLVNSWAMHYFGLTQDFLVIRNHNFVWKTKIYRLTDIKEIVFEAQVRQPNCMRVITKNYENKLYPAGTLRDKTWLDLKDKLEAKGITVRNECRLS